jgi:glycine/D-amino acid oxidase-like deaminating enzyme
MPVIVAGAGIAGISTAYHLAVRQGVRDVILLDPREPMTLTSDKGTQGYRNWWPGPDDTMLRFVSHSIDLLEALANESDNAFRLSRRGYLFATARDDGVEQLRVAARAVSGFGMGELREHRGAGTYAPALAEGFRDQPTGADLLLDGEATRAFPYLSEETRAALHIRRAGWLNAVALGNWLLRRAVAAGVQCRRDRLTSVDHTGGRVRAVGLASGSRIEAEQLIIAAGPELPSVVDALGLDLPVFHELHAKLTVRDPRGVMARSAPFSIWIDPVQLAWGADEREALGASAATRRLLEPFPAGVHARPVDGPHGDELYVIWTYHNAPTDFVWPPRFDSHYGEICLRGLAGMMPGMAAYFGTAHRVDGGYYCRTRENRPLIGPLPIEGVFVVGALGGSGIMSAQAAAELVVAHVTGSTLPSYAHWFLPSRYDDPVYRAAIEQWGDVGQL